MSLLQKNFTALIDPAVLRAHQKPILLTAALAAALTPLLAYIRSSYRAWLALGPGGIPHHFLGWLLQVGMRALARSDTREPLPRPYTRLEDVAAAYGPAGERSYFGYSGTTSLPARSGDRPAVPSFVVPQRQTSDKADAATVAREEAFLDALARANPRVFEARASRLEGPLHRALWLRLPREGSDEDEDDAGKNKQKQEELRIRLGRGAEGEFAHVHGEGSVHLTMSPGDAKTVIESGWGERHRLSGVLGTRGILPWGYVLVYAPRDEEEFGVLREIILAGARYASEGAGVEVVVPEE
ncbi:uncharacterized protein F4812DRAFT_466513 [Daldinia caldariorum]|uniref:uncharacterized protein n=1 Tax=Daldinia caldariorum TaxID=326644 RepID=UPI002007594E|nr:uncharacterized protein F4812DRAFT_466513 [Daldinia caldariorum]KAI1465536.1 hypothetical protein F4812DRAFT_466513 [Daldinia caldariorum]